ncbi:cytochrome ubiquinol oxidase subunit I [Synechococcus elongatus]|uniref:cytochrome ubiquinol oxidase subunit I n=1 Tax=Synechococcus elongatus TaxID=32046 RepID=UPI000F7D8E5C
MGSQSPLRVMSWLADTATLSRLQFAVTAIFHMLWPVLTTGLAIFLVIVEGMWLRTRNPDYYHHARFWSKLYVLNFGIGVASGLPMEFQFGTNWAPFSEAVGDFFGSILGFEGAMAFMLEAGFLGIMLFGWNRVPPPIHYLATIMVAFGANLSTFWILAANSWMQTPAGTLLQDGHFQVLDYFRIIFNPFMVVSVSHMFLATLETSLFMVGGISAWYLLRDREAEFFRRSFVIVLSALIAIAPLQIWVGHLSGEQVWEYQPTKLAAMEAQWKTIPAGETAPWSVLAWPDTQAETNRWSLEVPQALGWILEFQPRLSRPLKGLSEWEPRDRPSMVGLVFYAFRVMVGIGFALAGLMLLTGLQWLRGRLTRDRWLLWGWVLAAPLGYIAVESGWIVRCVGRQPWLVYGQLRTLDAASDVPAGAVASSLGTFLLLYSVLFVTALFFGRRILLKGPDRQLPLPETIPAEPAVVES